MLTPPTIHSADHVPLNAILGSTGVFHPTHLWGRGFGLAASSFFNLLSGAKRETEGCYR